MTILRGIILFVPRLRTAARLLCQGNPSLAWGWVLLAIGRELDWAPDPHKR